MSFLPLACSVCFGDPSSSLTQGALAAVWVLMGIVASVLFGIGYTAWSWSRRARSLAKVSGGNG